MRAIAAIMSTLVLAACSPSAPPVAAAGGDSALKARLAELYPPGSGGARLRADLAAQGFAVAGDPAGGRWSAIDRPENLPCYSRTRIDWREDRRGRIVVLTAQRNLCT